MSARRVCVRGRVWVWVCGGRGLCASPCGCRVCCVCLEECAGRVSRVCGVHLASFRIVRCSPVMSVLLVRDRYRNGPGRPPCPCPTLRVREWMLVPMGSCSAGLWPGTHCSEWLGVGWGWFRQGSGWTARPSFSARPHPKALTKLETWRGSRSTDNPLPQDF